MLRRNQSWKLKQHREPEDRGREDSSGTKIQTAKDLDRKHSTKRAQSLLSQSELPIQLGFVLLPKEQDSLQRERSLD